MRTSIKEEDGTDELNLLFKTFNCEREPSSLLKEPDVALSSRGSKWELALPLLEVCAGFNGLILGDRANKSNAKPISSLCIIYIIVYIIHQLYKKLKGINFLKENTKR